VSDRFDTFHIEDLEDVRLFMDFKSLIFSPGVGGVMGVDVDQQVGVPFLGRDDDCPVAVRQLGHTANFGIEHGGAQGMQTNGIRVGILLKFFNQLGHALLHFAGQPVKRLEYLAVHH
jgi:hypothetical protein